MGALSAFTCPRCSYRAEVSGGEDRGELTGTVTIVCTDCRKLYDITVCRFERDATPHDVVPPHCPVDVRHAINPWLSGDPCPVCGEVLHDGGLVILWD